MDQMSDEEDEGNQVQWKMKHSEKPQDQFDAVDCSHGKMGFERGEGGGACVWMELGERRYNRCCLI